MGRFDQHRSNTEGVKMPFSGFTFWLGGESIRSGICDDIAKVIGKATAHIRRIIE